ncbi:MAG: NUDIX domain-containing protein [Paracoccaceae bacterium]
MSKIKLKTPRLAVRAVIVEQDKLLLVNAWPDGQSELMCAPGGGVNPHASLPDNLIREVFEETGLTIAVGPVCLVNEFHDPHGSFHQVDVYFRCHIVEGQIDDSWQDPERIVTQRRWVTRAQMGSLMVKPDSLADVAFDPDQAITYDPLEPLVR